MKILYAKSFERDIGAIEHIPEIRKRLCIVIENLKIIDSLREVHGIKKIAGYENYYRMKLGDYRLGLKLSEDSLELIRFLHRKEIYR